MVSRFLLDAEAADDSVLYLPELQHVDDLVHVGDLLLSGDASVLTEDGGELECFPDRGCLVVEIHLLAEPRAALELEAQGTAVD